MTSVWSPELWDDFGVVGIVVALGVAHMVAYIRGWLIPGRHHREIIDGKDRALAELRDRSAIDAETIKLQAKTISERDVMEDATTRLMQAFHESVKDR